MIQLEIFKQMQNLPDHLKLCRELIQFFSEQKEITSGFLSGSSVTGGMDSFSDLDLGFVCESEEAKNQIWSKRFDWKLCNWFHRMDADHVKPFFVIYLFEPQIHVDLCFYTMENLPNQAGGPFAIAFDPQSQLRTWETTMNRPITKSPDWSNVVHEEEQIWTWIHYAWCHVGRGEYYDIAAEFAFLRKIPHNWFARLKGSEQFSSRRLENRGEAEFIESMRLCYPMPNRGAMKAALLNLITVHNFQRIQVNQLLNPAWKTSQVARDKITRLVEQI